MTQPADGAMILDEASEGANMYRNIVVGFDGSEESRDALALASHLRPWEGIVTAVNVYKGRRTELAAAAYDRLSTARVDTAGEHWLRTEIFFGSSSAQGLRRFIEDSEADLIVVGSSNRGRIGQTLAGSVGQRLLNGSSCPVAVAPRGYRGRPPNRIWAVAVGVDGSRESELALCEAAGLATATDACLELIAVVEPSVVAYGKGAGALQGIPELQEAVEEIVTRRLRDAAEQVPDSLSAKAVIAHGEPAAELANAARTEDAVLVVGSRAYGPLRRVLLGSVSTELINTATCPVIVVPRGAEVPDSSESETGLKVQC